MAEHPGDRRVIPSVVFAVMKGRSATLKRQNLLRMFSLQSSLSEPPYSGTPEHKSDYHQVTKAHLPTPIVADVRPKPEPALHQLDVEAILDGDERAFEALVRQESPRLYRLIVRILRDEDEAQSVLQETFLKAYEGLSSFRREARLTTWLYGIALNQARSARRKRRREQVMEEQDIDRLQPSFRMGMYKRKIEAWDPEKTAEMKERVDLVHSAIDRLPDKYRDVILLRDMNELSTSEAAEVLDITEGSLRVRLHRARQALRALLETQIRG